MTKLASHPCKAGERFVLLEQNVLAMKEWFDKLEKKMQGFDEKLDHLVEKMDQRYASKSSLDKLWGIVWGVIGFVFVALGWALMRLLMK